MKIKLNWRAIAAVSLCVCAVSYTATLCAQVQITVDATQKIATVTKFLNGTNIEDLNNQTNGGLSSQLIHGEAFEENIDPDFLNLARRDYSKIYVVLDERRIPHLITQSQIYTRIAWNNIGDKYDFNSKDVYGAGRFNRPEVISGWSFPGRFLVYDSLPANIQRVMLDRINGNEQISKFWNKLQSGSAQFKYTLERNGDAYMGRQTQVVTFAGGAGEVGITNHGLYKSGIRFDAGKPYEGVLRIKAAKPTTIYLSLRDENGKALAEQPYQLKGDGTYEKVVFELTPNGKTIKGSFGVALKQQGEIRLGFAFLEPGEWGRIEGGYHIRKSFTDALKRQGILAFRFNGSMVDVGADTYMYRWKRMIGEVDERRTTLRTGFNLYATHTFGFIEMLQAAESIGAVAIIGMCMDETAEDIRDFVEYCNGSVDTKWGALRAKHGHPAPYGLKYIQVDNERGISVSYNECMKKFAKAAWSVDPNVSIMTSLNIGGNGYRKYPTEQEKERIAALEAQIASGQTEQQQDGFGGRRGAGTPQQQLAALRAQIGSQYRLALDLAKWFVAQGKGDKLSWDPHYSGALNFADRGDNYLNEMGVNLQKWLSEDIPGFKLVLAPMEENGSRCDWDRGLAHAHNWNTNQRYGDSFLYLGTANTFQPHGLHYMWDQGRIHYTADTIWFQPSAYVDEIMMQTWKPNVVQTSWTDEQALDVTAKINDAGTEMTLYIVNLANEPKSAVININGFKYKTKADVISLGDCDLTTYNTYEAMNTIVPKHTTATIKKKDATYTFPRYSYTVITLRK